MAKRVRVYDTEVRVVHPVVAGLLCLGTLGVVGAVRHCRLNGDLARLGRRRGTMPFSFIACSPGAATTAWVFGLLGWALAVASVVAFAIDYTRGVVILEPELITGAAGLALLVTPLWMTALHTARRVRTAQHLVGVEVGVEVPWRAAVAAVLFPPVGVWWLQRSANRAWRTWEGWSPEALAPASGGAAQ